MAADTYRLFRALISDENTDYTVTDFVALYYLDRAIDKLSEVSDFRVTEDVTIDATDIANGYVELSNDIVTIISSTLGAYDTWNTLYSKPEAENIYWQFEGGKKIRFIDTDYINVGTYEFTYRKRFKKFDGEVRDNDYFDYPDDVELGIVLWALAEYQQTKGIINADDSMNVIANKSEEGMSVSYATMTTMNLANPRELQSRALSIFRNIGNPTNNNFSITV